MCRMHDRKKLSDPWLIQELQSLDVSDRIPEIVERIFLDKSVVHQCDKNNDTPLHHAVRREGLADIIKALVKCGANFKAKNDQGDTPLHISAAHSIRNSILLMQLGAKDNVINLACQLPEDVFHQTFKGHSWFDIMPDPQVIVRNNRTYYSIDSQKKAECLSR